MSHTDPTPNPDPTTPLLATIQRQQAEIIELNKKLEAADQAALIARSVERSKDAQIAGLEASDNKLEARTKELIIVSEAGKSAQREAEVLRLALRDLSIVITSLTR